MELEQTLTHVNNPYQESLPQIRAKLIPTFYELSKSFLPTKPKKIRIEIRTSSVYL